MCCIRFRGIWDNTNPIQSTDIAHTVAKIVNIDDYKPSANTDTEILNTGQNLDTLNITSFTSKMKN